MPRPKKPTRDPKKDIEAAVKLRDKHGKDWSRNVRAYLGKRTNIKYQGDFNPFVQETHTIAESIVAYIAGGNHEIGFIPNNINQKKDTKIVSELINYWLEKNKFGILKQLATRGSIQKGNAYWYAEWDPTQKIPKIKYIDVQDMILDPTGTCLSDSFFIGHTYMTSMRDLKSAYAVDAETGKTVKKYKNLDKLGSLDVEKLNPEVRRKLEDSTIGPRALKEQVMVDVLFYRDGSIVEMANRNTVIRDVESPYQRSKTTKKATIYDPQTDSELSVDQEMPEVPLTIPYAEVRGFIDPHSHYSRGEISLIVDRQEHLNDLEAQDLDNTQYINNVIVRVDPQYEGMIDQIKSKPGMVAAMPRGALEFMDRPSPNIDLDLKKNEIKDEMRRVTGADEIVQGVSLERGRVTATEIGTQLEQSARRFQVRIDNMENEGLAQLAVILLRFAQLFVTQEMAVRVLGPEGVEFKNFNPDEYQGDYEPVVKLRTSIEDKRREMDNRMQPVWELVLTDPQVNRREAIKAFMEERGFSDERIKLILGASNEQGIQGAQGGVPQEQGFEAPQSPAGLPTGPGGELPAFG